MNLKLDDVKDDDRWILSPCGIPCIGCDTHIGEGLEAAKKLQEIWEGWNLADVGPFLGLSLRGIKSTLKTLESVIKAGKQGNCPGCFVGGGPSKICGIANCVKSKGYWTCAECEDYNPESETPCPHITPNPVPMADKGSMAKMICARYSRDTAQNLKKCREIGYNEFIKWAKEKVADGWRTWQVVSKDMIFTDATKK